MSVEKDCFFSSEQEIFRKTVRRFVKKEIAPEIERWEEQRCYDKDIFKRMGDLGFLGLTYPEEYAGQGQGIKTSLVFWEELCRCGALGFVISVIASSDLATPSLAHEGSHEQKNKYLRGVCTGEKVAGIAMTEPDYGSDLASIKTKAVLEGDHYRVNGSKMFITNATQADFLITVVRTGKPGHKGISLMLIDTDTPGFSISRKLEKMGNHSSDTAEIHFDHCMVPKEQLLGRENEGWAALMHGLEIERMGVATLSTMGATLGLEESMRYAKQRKQFGRPIIEFQAVGHMIAEMVTEIEAGRQLVYHAASMHDAGLKCNREASLAKLYCTEMAVRVLDKAVQIHGGYGYMKEFLVERLYRDVKLYTIGGGTSQVQKNIILSEMGLT